MGRRLAGLVALACLACAAPRHPGVYQEVFLQEDGSFQPSLTEGATVVLGADGSFHFRSREPSHLWEGGMEVDGQWVMDDDWVVLDGRERAGERASFLVRWEWLGDTLVAPHPRGARVFRWVR